MTLKMTEYNIPPPIYNSSKSIEQHLVASKVEIKEQSCELPVNDHNPQVSSYDAMCSYLDCLSPEFPLWLRSEKLFHKLNSQQKQRLNGSALLPKAIIFLLPSFTIEKSI